MQTDSSKSQSSSRGNLRAVKSFVEKLIFGVKLRVIISFGEKPRAVLSCYLLYNLYIQVL